MERHRKFSSIGDIMDPRKPYITKIRKINKIVLHCSAQISGDDATAKDIDEMHRQRWGANSGCGYHFIIRADGVVERGRWSDSAGSHAGPDAKIGRKSSNVDTIAICYIGGLDKNLKILKEGMNEKQKETAIILLAALKRGYELKAEDIIGHNELPKVNKGCPCTDMHDLRRKVYSANY